MKRCLAAIAIVAICAGPVFAKRKPRPTSQPDITQGCVSVRDIRYHGLSILSGIGAPMPGIEGVIVNECRTTEFVTIRIGYFDYKRQQIGEGIENLTVAAGVRRPFYHREDSDPEPNGVATTAWIIQVQVFEQ